MPVEAGGEQALARAVGEKMRIELGLGDGVGVAVQVLAQVGDEAVALANGTDYGLGGVCYGETGHATGVAQRVRTGFIWVNSFGIRDLAAPFGGIKRSGIGREGGDWSFEFFCDIKDVVVPRKPFRASFSQR